MHVEHREGSNEITMEFYLGRYNKTATRLAQQRHDEAHGGSSNGKRRYHVHVYTNGTTCDLTNTGRRTEVRHFCEEGSQSYIAAIKEGPTCEYDLILNTNLLCAHSQFRVMKQPIHFINCHAYPGQSSLPEAIGAGSSTIPTSDTNLGSIEDVSKEEVDLNIDNGGELKRKDGEEAPKKQGDEASESEGVEIDDDEDDMLLVVDPEVEEIEEELSAL
eukprot:TRINITY_DN20531_c0_g2_i2.p1 TRINITY_DN20531_c0_g2~~TRINITY_DN20531_c0_g2_i2.p1  ORF type:complete len:248 (-),score=29.62 TRINITY_DN20531_c0_g2_i2:70-720(-)